MGHDLDLGTLAAAYGDFFESMIKYRQNPVKDYLPGHFALSSRTPWHNLCKNISEIVNIIRIYSRIFHGFPHGEKTV
jgi:hypothetical protein